MMQRNAPLIQAVAKQQRQKEIDQAVQLALEQKVRETATLEPEPTPLSMTPIPISIDRSWSNYAILGIAVVGFLLFLRSRA